mmetsp:Transcript_30219/g.95335  ORF Transcript_30219/g.95335 Transcript_30219/m.95335 type:complete len:236 (+) Transcript_30219:584-1291(+)
MAASAGEVTLAAAAVVSAPSHFSGAWERLLPSAGFPEYLGEPAKSPLPTPCEDTLALPPGGVTLNIPDVVELKLRPASAGAAPPPLLIIDDRFRTPSPCSSAFLRGRTSATPAFRTRRGEVALRGCPGAAASAGPSGGPATARTGEALLRKDAAVSGVADCTAPPGGRATGLPSGTDLGRPPTADAPQEAGEEAGAAGGRPEDRASMSGACQRAMRLGATGTPVAPVRPEANTTL